MSTISKNLRALILSAVKSLVAYPQLQRFDSLPSVKIDSIVYAVISSTKEAVKRHAGEPVSIEEACARVASSTTEFSEKFLIPTGVYAFSDDKLIVGEMAYTPSDNEWESYDDDLLMEAGDRIDNAVAYAVMPFMPKGKVDWNTGAWNMGVIGDVEDAICAKLEKEGFGFCHPWQGEDDDSEESFICYSRCEEKCEYCPRDCSGNRWVQYSK